MGGGDIHRSCPSGHVEWRRWVIEQREGRVLEIGIQQGRVDVGARWAGEYAVLVMPGEEILLFLFRLS